jgi:L-ectoine synthase
MIIRTLDEIADTERDVRGEGWRSRRILLRDDAMAHSLHWTEIAAGSELTLWYKHHLEANLIISGEGEVQDLATGKVHPLGPGSLYALDKNDRHVVRAHTDMKLVCVFTPALTGRETHDEDGSYRPS